MQIEYQAKMSEIDRRLDAKVREIVDECLRKEAILLELDVNERSITHKIAEYLQRDFRTEGYDVDCEYNRNGHDPKTLSLEPWSTKSDSLEGDTVYPDIIIHKRESPTNLVVIEAKKSTNKVNFRDLQKLKAFRRELGYRLCYSLTLYVREDFKRTRLYEMREITA